PLDKALTEPDDGLDINTLHVADQTNYPLTVAALPGPTLEVHIAYDSGRFAAAGIAQLLDEFCTLLTGLTAAGPATRLQDLPLLPAGEQQRLLTDWNATEVAYPPGRCLHQLVEAQVARTPDAVAVVLGD